MYFHQSLARTFQECGITRIFGLLGDANLFLMNEFDQLEGCEFVSVVHEASALLAANGYHQTSGQLGVATVTHGPGLANTVTSLIEATKTRAPLLLISGDTAGLDRLGFQNIPQRELVLATGAGFEQVRNAETAADDVVRAIRRATFEECPIVLNVPIDLQWTDVPHRAPRVELPRQVTVAANATELDEALGVIASARRPVVLAGRGATSAAAREALIRLARKIGAPVTTSLRAVDLFVDEPLNLGICGASSTELAQVILAQADCVVSFGASLNRWTTSDGGLLEGSTVIQIDSDPASIGLHHPIDVGVVGDAATVAETFVSMLEEAELPATTFGNDAMAARIKEFNARPFEDRADGNHVDIRHALREIDRIFPQDRTLVVDGGRFSMSTFGTVHVRQPSAYVHTLSFSSIGLAMGNAIGAAYGSDRPVLVICGDGGFMLGGLYEFSTAVRHGLDVVVVVLNDGGYGAEHIQFRNRELDPRLSHFDWPDLASVAQSMGGTGFDVRTNDDLRNALASLDSRRGPVLLNVHFDPDKIDPNGYLYGPGI